MSAPTDTRHADLERRLRAAADAVPARPVATDAWVKLQARLATRDGRHSRRLLGAAAVVALVLALVGAATLLDDGSHDASPAGGSSGDEAWAPENILGEPVVAETLTLSGQETRHELVLTDTDGKGPSLCDRYVDVATGSGAGGCTARQERADDPSVAIDWISGSTGSGDIHSVEAGVDSRVMKVQVWMSNGDEMLADLQPTGWDDTKMFALTMQDAHGPVPQRLVAYSDATGTVLQAVDLGHFFGHGWLPRGGKTCSGAPTGTWPQPGTGDTGGVGVALWGASASVSLPGTEGTTCIALGQGSLAGLLRRAGHVVVVTGPEVVTVELRTAEEASVPGSSRKVAPSAMSPFQVADVPEPPRNGAGYRIVALDVSGHAVDSKEIPNP
jgi:hypothetical protein